MSNIEFFHAIFFVIVMGATTGVIAQIINQTLKMKRRIDNIETYLFGSEEKQ